MRKTIHAKIRRTISGTAERPRLAVYRSLTNIYAQLIDDQASKTVLGVGSIKMSGSLVAKASTVGEQIAQKAKELKIKKAVFDRGGFQYHGAVKAVAEAARKHGLEF